MRELVRITDSDDERIAPYRDIRERDLVRRQNGFIAEGTVVLTMLLAAHERGGPFFARSLLLLENRVAGLMNLLEKVPADVPVYVVEKTVMNAIAGFDMHRGVLAIGEYRQGQDPADMLAGLAEEALVVAACGIANHDNVGAIFRSAAAFGADCVLLDETSCDPLYRKAIRVSVGSVFSVPYIRGGSAHAMIDALVKRDFALWGLSPRGTTDIRAVPAHPRIALLTGTEGEGLPQEILDTIRTARIPQMPGLDSLNAATATGIALFALSNVMGRLPS